MKFLKNKKILSLLFLVISAQLFCEEVIVPVFYSTNEIEEAYWSKDSKSFAYKTNNKVYIRNTEDLMLTDIVADFPKSYIINDVVKKGYGVKIDKNNISLSLADGEKSFYCPQKITSYDISDDGDTLILGSNSGSLFFYDIPTNKELGSTPPLTSGSATSISSIRINNNENKVLVSKDNELFYLQLDDLLYSVDSKKQVTTKNFTIPYEIVDVSTLENNIIKEFVVQHVTKRIDNVEPEFIKTESSQDDSKLKFKIEDSKKVAEVQEETILHQDLQFDYTKKEDSTNKTLKKRTNENESKALITELQPNVRESQMQEFLLENQNLNDLYKSNLNDFSNENEKILPPKVVYSKKLSTNQRNPNQQYDFRKDNFNQNAGQGENQNNSEMLNANQSEQENNNSKGENQNKEEKDKDKDKDKNKEKDKDKDKNKDDSEFSRKKQFLVIGATGATAPDPFLFSVGLSIGYENFKLLYPFYFGAFFKPQIGFTSPSFFPYHYKTADGSDFPVPGLIRGQLVAEVGYCVTLSEKHKLDLLISLCVGANVSTIWNFNFSSSVASNFYFSFYADANVAIAYRYIYAMFTASYDAMLGFNFGGGLGLSIKLGK